MRALLSLWSSLLVDLKLPRPDPLWCQSVNQHLFDVMKLNLVKACALDVNRKSEEPGYTVIATDEENALRYASGFVPFKLLKRYSEQRGPDPEAEAVAECLPQMAVPEKFSSYYDYTKEWLEKVDR